MDRTTRINTAVSHSETSWFFLGLRTGKTGLSNGKSVGIKTHSSLRSNKTKLDFYLAFLTQHT